MPAEIRHVGDRAFVLRQGVWTDTRYDPSRMKPIRIAFASPAYFQLLERYPECAGYLALGQEVLFVADGQAYQVVAEAGPGVITERLPAEPTSRLDPILRWLRQLDALFDKMPKR
jgi:hypothetical protein